MGFFDKLSEKASSTMQSAKDKTNKISAEMKLKSQISDKKDRINVLYSEIGKEVYSNYLKGINENTETVIQKSNEIKTINDQLSSLNKELLTLKGIKICTSCGSQIPSGSEFCPKCGNKVVEVTQAAPVEATQTEVADEETKTENTENVENSDNTENTENNNEQ